MNEPRSRDGERGEERSRSESWTTSDERLRGYGEARFLASFFWGGWIRTNEWRSQSPLPYRLATPHRALASQMARQTASPIIALATSSFTQ